MRVGDKVVVPDRMGEQRGEVVEVRKYVGCPYLVKFPDGQRWCGPADMRKEAQP